MGGDFTPEQKKAIGEFVKYRLAIHRLDQAKVAAMRNCTTASISTAIWQSKAMHTDLVGLKNFIAEKVGYKDWAELCAEALAQEEMGA